MKFFHQTHRSPRKLPKALDCGDSSPLSQAGLVPRPTPQGTPSPPAPKSQFLPLPITAFLTALLLSNLQAQDPAPPPASPGPPPSEAPAPATSPGPAPTPPPTNPAAPQFPSPPPDQILTKLPRVWIFNGLPGDEENHAFDEANLASLKQSLTTRYGLPDDHLTILYGPKSAGYDGVCTPENFRAELAKITALTKSQPPSTPANLTSGSASSQSPTANPSAEPAPAWIILHGHANSIPGGAMFNIPGTDLTAREIAAALEGAGSPGAPLVIIATTEASAQFLKALAGPNRIILSATSDGDKDNGTEFPQALAEALAAPASDTNHDGILTLTELFLSTSANVHRLYDAGPYMLKEHAQLDGDGDGKGTQRPAAIDAKPASAIGLRITQTTQKFD